MDQKGKAALWAGSASPVPGPRPSLKEAARPVTAPGWAQAVKVQVLLGRELEPARAACVRWFRRVTTSAPASPWLPSGASGASRHQINPFKFPVVLDGVISGNWAN